MSLFLSSSATSCTLMNARYKKWNASVSRTSDGILKHALPKEYGNGENALLLIHGFGDGPNAWNRLAPQLAKQGYSVRAMRLPAWGEPMESKHKASLEDWDHAILKELHALRQTHDKVAVLAHSMGGCLSTVLAQDQKLPADALVLYAPMFEISSARSPILKTHTWFKIGSKLLPKRMVIESIYGEHCRVHPPRHKTERDPFNPKSFITMLFAEIDRFEKQAPQMTITLRLVLPGKDLVVHVERSQQWYQTLRAPEKQLFTYESAGHVLPLDIDVLAESQRLTVWLSEQGITP